MHGKEAWVLVQLGSQNNLVERSFLSVFPDCPSISYDYDESIDISINKPFQNSEILLIAISENDFRNLLDFATKQSYFTFNCKFYL